MPKKKPIKIWTSLMIQVRHKGKPVLAKRLKMDAASRSVVKGTLWFYELSESGRLVTKLRGGEPPGGKRYVSVLKAPVYVCAPEASENGRTTFEVMVMASHPDFTTKELWSLHYKLLAHGKRREK